MGRGLSYDVRHSMSGRGRPHYGPHSHYHRTSELRHPTHNRSRHDPYHYDFEPHHLPDHAGRNYPGRHFSACSSNGSFGDESRQGILSSYPEPRHAQVYSDSMHNRSVRGRSPHDRIELNPEPRRGPAYYGRLHDRIRLDPETRRASARYLRSEARPQGSASNVPEKKNPTCFFWYHGGCAAGDACKLLHRLTEPPTVVTPPPGYIHWEECNLRLCALRPKGKPEGLPACDSVRHEKESYRKPLGQPLDQNRRDGRRVRSNRVTKKGGKNRNKAKRGKETKSAAARSLLSTTNLVQDTTVTKDSDDDLARVGSVAEDKPTGYDDMAKEWFLKGFD